MFNVFQAGSKHSPESSRRFREEAHHHILDDRLSYVVRTYSVVRSISHAYIEDISRLYKVYLMPV